MFGGRHAIRFREEFEMRCDRCGEWLPLTALFWNPRQSLARCRACTSEAHRGAQLRYLAEDGSRVTAKVAANRRWYARHRVAILERRRAA